MTCSSAGSYVLGALPAAERQEFERHLDACADCRHEVEGLAGLPGLLSRVTPADLADPPATSPNLLPRLLAAGRRSGQRRVALGAVLAAALLALVAGVGIARSTEPAPPATALKPVVATHLKATAQVDAATGGSRIELHCSYLGYARPLRTPYELVITDRAGASSTLATWRVGPDHEATITGSVDLPPSQIATIEVRTGTGSPVLRLTR